ncbi:hypothetical protein NM208_g14129 [Fusarium decemcellulare]|uniref:Uncharacterized protein n=1 Tax=Fusarium decemcellulare TaxID=57161 RepID=A0ACC1RHT7_9HYPO|nr:hypothetical protein NM208_g14129 [Fusarium decemcellulare]
MPRLRKGSDPLCFGVPDLGLASRRQTEETGQLPASASATEVRCGALGYYVRYEPLNLSTVGAPQIQVGHVHDIMHAGATAPDDKHLRKSQASNGSVHGDHPSISRRSSGTATCGYKHA